MDAYLKEPKGKELQSKGREPNMKSRLGQFIKKHRKAVVILAVLAVIVVAVSIWSSKAKSKMQELAAMASMPEIAEVERRSLVESISATGTVVSAESKSVTIPVTGVEVTEVKVAVGDTVNAGDILCIMDTTDLEENLANAKLNYEAAQKKSEIEIASAQRSLSEAETSRTIEVERANQDEADAQNDYLKSVTDVEEAEDDYQEAQQTTISKNAEYELAQQKMEDAKSDMEKLASGAGKSSGYEATFAQEAEAFKKALGQSLSEDKFDTSQIYITNANLAQALEEVVKDDADKAAVASILEQYKGTLLGLQGEYKKAIKADKAYQEAQADYQQLQQEVSSWQQKYNTAKQSESSLEAAYEQSINTSESKQDAYTQKKRNSEDAVRNNDSSISNKTDNLTSAQINATTSGLNEKQQIRKYEEQIEDCTVKAPISGVITSLGIESGDTYNGAEIALIENTNAYEIETEIDEYDINKIKEGQKVVIKTNGTGDTEMEGTVISVAPRASSSAAGNGTSSTTVTYKVTISVDSEDAQIRMDMTAKLSIIIDSRENVLTVPYDAVQEDEDGSFYVEVQEDAGEAPEGEAPEGEKPEGEMPDLQSDTENAAEPPKEQGKQQGQVQPVTGRRIIVEKGIESDYYVEIISDEITEGMQILVPAAESEGMNFNDMMMYQGPMGGF